MRGNPQAYLVITAQQMLPITRHQSQTMCWPQAVDKKVNQLIVVQVCWVEWEELNTDHVTFSQGA